MAFNSSVSTVMGRLPRPRASVRAPIFVCLSEAVVQTVGLTLATGRRVHHQNPLWPLAWPVGVVDPTGALDFVPLSHSHLLTLIIRSAYALEFADRRFGSP